jgi:hypothetical protein
MPHGSHAGDTSAVGSLALMDAAVRVAIRFEIVTAPLTKMRPISAALTNVVIATPIVRVTELTGAHAAAMFPKEQT